jgi:universal stress protein E
MNRIRRILLALKTADANEMPALEKAIQLAKAFRASLEIYHAITIPVAAHVSLTQTRLREMQRQALDTQRERLELLAARARSLGVKVAVKAEWDYPPHEAIVRRAARIKADLIVAQCHAGRRLAPWAMHLTDFELLRTSPAPVLLVKTHEPYERPIVLAAVDPLHIHAKPAKLDTEILSAASRVTDALSGSLHAMYAFFPWPVHVPLSKTVSETPDMLYEQWRAQVRKALARTAGERVPRARQHLVEHHPVDAIPGTARELGADILVMGAVSRSGLKRVFIGNTAELVLGNVHCDVLVVKPRNFVRRVVSRPRAALHAALVRDEIRDVLQIA